MDAQNFDPNRRLNTRAEARAAFDDTLSETELQLRLFDDQGSFYGLERRSVAEQCRRLLRQRRDSRIQIIVHDTGYIERQCPRMIALIREFSPRIQVMATEPSIRSYSRGILISDQRVVLRRPHFDQPMTVVDYEDAAIAAAAALFEDLLGNSAPAISGGVAGL